MMDDNSAEYRITDELRLVTDPPRLILSNGAPPGYTFANFDALIGFYDKISDVGT